MVGWDSGFLKDDDASLVQEGSDTSQIVKKQCHLKFRLSLGAAAKKDHRGFCFLPRSEQSTKVSIRRYYYSLFAEGPLKDFFILCFLHAVVTDVYCIVACLAQAFRDQR